MTNQSIDKEVSMLFEPGAYQLPAFMMTAESFYEFCGKVAKHVTGADYVELVRIQRRARRVWMGEGRMVSIKPLMFMAILLSVPAEKYAAEGYHTLAQIVALTKQYERDSVRIWDSVAPDLQVYTSENIALWEAYSERVRGLLYSRPSNTGVNSANGDSADVNK